MTLRFDIAPGSPEWHEIRMENVGASETAALHGLQADYAPSAYTLWAVKSGRIPPQPVDSSPGTRVWRGKLMEPVIVEMARQQFKLSIRYPGPYAVNDDCEGMAASLDGVIEEPGEVETKLGFRGPGLLETKCLSYRSWKEHWTQNEPNYPTILQSQHGIDCAKFGWGIVVADVQETGLIAYRYRMRPPTINVLRAKVKDFWERVRTGRPPDVDATASTAQALRDSFPPRALPEALELSTEFDTIAHLFDVTRVGIKEEEKKEALCRNQLIAGLAGVTEARTENYRISYRPDKNGKRTLRVEPRIGQL